MKIELHNFGPIKYFEFDLDKDFHAIFGKNNIGKSYALSAVYLIVKTIANHRDVAYYRTKINEYLYWSRGAYPKPLQKSMENNEIDVIDISEGFGEALRAILSREFLDNMNQSFQNSFAFDAIQNKFQNEALKINIVSDFAQIHLGLTKEKDKLQINEVIVTSSLLVKKTIEKQSPEITDNGIVFYRTIGLNRNELEEYLIVCVQKMISYYQQIQSVYFLPASRSGLYNALSTFGAIMAELSQSRAFVRSKIELPNISEPVSDYFLNLSSVKNSRAVHSLTELAQDIETNILKGRVSFNTKTKKFFYQPENLDIELDLAVTSSMISEIAPIVAHLKFILSNKDKKAKSLLFIEEPEAHLHPEIQVKLIEFFVQLTDYNVKVVMTSHSNYIFNKLSNLIIGKKINPKRISISLMEMGDNGSEAKKEAMKIDEYGIEDQNFADVAEDLYEERMLLIDDINRKIA